MAGEFLENNERRLEHGDRRQPVARHRTGGRHHRATPARSTSRSRPGGDAHVPDQRRTLGRSNDRLDVGAIVAVVALALAVGVLAAGSVARPQPVDAAAGCRIYVAAGDDIPNGHDLERRRDALPGTAPRGPPQVARLVRLQPGQERPDLVELHHRAAGWPSAYNKRSGPPDHPARRAEHADRRSHHQRASTRSRITTSAAASAAPSAILGQPDRSGRTCKKNYTTILQMTRIMAAQRPVAGRRRSSNYPNPYPQVNATSNGEDHRSCASALDRCDAELHGALGSAAHRPSIALDQVLPEAEQDPQGRGGAVPAGAQRLPLGVRRRLSRSSRATR